MFLHCFSRGHAALQTIALQIIADILITHPSLLADPPATTADATEATVSSENVLRKHVLKAFSRSLKSDDPSVQSTGATALAKTMLSRLITDADLLRSLIIAFFDPDTASNAHLRQSLSYFLPVYAHSRADNAKLMVSVAPGVVAKLCTLREAFLDEAEADSGVEADGGMVKLSVVGGMLVDWTDPRKIVGFTEAVGAAAAGETHFLLAEAILERLVTSQVGKEERKVLFGMLGKLHWPADGCDGERLKTVLELLQEAIDTGVASDATSRNTLSKLQKQGLNLIREIMTAERGGGGTEETVLETTELPVAGNGTEMMGEEDGEEGGDVTQMQPTMRDATLGATTFAAPDAEGTRVGLEGDSDLLSEEDEEYTEI